LLLSWITSTILVPRKSKKTHEYGEENWPLLYTSSIANTFGSLFRFGFTYWSKIFLAVVLDTWAIFAACSNVQVYFLKESKIILTVSIVTLDLFVAKLCFEEYVLPHSLHS